MWLSIPLSPFTTYNTNGVQIVKMLPYFSSVFTVSLLLICNRACYKSSAVAEMGDCGHNRHGPKKGGSCDLSRGAQILLQCGLGRGLLPYQVVSSSIQPFGHNSHGPKIRWWGWMYLFFWGELCPIQQSPGPRPISIPSGILVHPAVWPQRTLAENWGLYHFRGGEAGFPSSTMLHRPRPTSVPSGIIVHPAVWPQRTLAENRGSVLLWGRGSRVLI